MPTLHIKMTVRGTDPQPLIDFVEGFNLRGAVAIRILKQAMIMAVMRQIRAKFINNLAAALQTTVITEATSAERVREAGSINMIQGRLKMAYNNLDRAVLGNDKTKIKSARLRIFELREQVEKKILRSTGSGQGIRTLSSADAQMRRRAGLVLNLLADPALLDTGIDGDGNFVGLGRIRRLDEIQTPSATYRLVKRATDSQYRILWRQLELGTGAEARGGGTPWRYGGLMIKGTTPMGAIFGKNFQWETGTLEEIERQLDVAMDAVAPKFE